MKESFLFLAHGFEEVEALSAVDILRRADIDIKTVSITDSLQVTGAHGVQITCDLIFKDASMDNADWLILPGGMPGATNLYEFAPLRELLTRQASSKNGRIAAICASPAVVLGQMGLLKGEHATCYPGFEHLCKGAVMEDAAVIVSGKFVLGNGPANAMKWAIRIVSEELGEHAAIKVANGLLYYPRDEKEIDFYFG